MRDPLSEINLYTAGLMASALAEQVRGKPRGLNHRKKRHKRATKNSIAKQSRKRNRKS